MIHTRTFFVAILAAVLSGLAVYISMPRHPEPLNPSEARFPIVSRFELPRDYGFFVGDEIPLTLIIEASDQVVLDLVNLPRKGEKHGMFEIRDLNISSSTSSDAQKVYRASYVLQYFGVTPLTTQFQRMEILYALSDNRRPHHDPHTYESLFTQPLTIHVSRIGPFRPTNTLDVKGPIEVRRQPLIWGSYALGVTALCVALGGGLRACRRRVRYREACLEPAPTVGDTVLQTLKQEGAALRPLEELVVPISTRLSDILRQYLHDACGVSAFTSTTSELALCLPDQPFYRELLLLLNRCEAVKYQLPEASQWEERQLWWEATALFEKLLRTDAS